RPQNDGTGVSSFFGRGVRGETFISAIFLPINMNSYAQQGARQQRKNAGLRVFIFYAVYIINAKIARGYTGQAFGGIRHGYILSIIGPFLYICLYKRWKRKKCIGTLVC